MEFDPSFRNNAGISNLLNYQGRNIKMRKITSHYKILRCTPSLQNENL